MSDSFENYQKPEKLNDKLDALLEVMAKEINKEWENKNKVNPLLKNNGRINMRAFAGFDWARDEEKIYNQEVKWGRIKVQEYEQSKAGTKNNVEIVAQFRKNKEEKPSGQLEKVVTCLFYKILKSDFLVVRSSIHDDYFNGIDTLIVDKENGNVICAFDEVHYNEEGEKYKDKKKKVLELNQSGGADLKYGLTFKKIHPVKSCPFRRSDSEASKAGISPEAKLFNRVKETGENKLIKKNIQHIPVFYLGLSFDELYKIAREIKDNLDKNPTPIELKVFDDLMCSVTEQLKDLENKKIPYSVKLNLEKFKQSLVKMRKIRYKD